MTGQYRVSQLAAAGAVPATTVRFYESAGLLQAQRSESGYRLFDDDALDRLTFIRAAKHVGLPLDEIGDLLSLRARAHCTEVRSQLRPKIATRLDEVREQIAELQAFARVLVDSLDQLDALPDRSAPCDPECGFLRAAGEPPRP
ncbi:MerR family transcriptional regulator [Nocardioides sp. IC4_145]|uniref:MerR family transcriptional regulator n=1 Tax=Nocardioides sp. IC4_145 TaxID=2714037 RepID=UPI001407497A|nr:MerR family transcriptional regulator [Nocardioides sp. IC4_145]NHC22977.1 MerR family transcriptional regulator [Nocardioides sp. IC4_145]